MNKSYRIIINILSFQVTWFTCVLMAAKNQPIIGIIVALIVVIIHLYLVENRLQVFD